jgi:hypothetical protein
MAKLREANLYRETMWFGDIQNKVNTIRLSQ